MKTTALLMVLLGAPAVTVTAFGQDIPVSLQTMKTVYVDSFGPSEGAEIIRAKVVNRLVQSKVVTVVEEKNGADAVLTGIAQISQGYQTHSQVGPYYGGASSGTTYDATLVVRLISQDHRILWVGEGKQGRFSRSASSAAADKVVSELLKSLKDSAKAKPPTK